MDQLLLPINIHTKNWKNQYTSHRTRTMTQNGVSLTDMCALIIYGTGTFYYITGFLNDFMNNFLNYFGNVPMNFCSLVQFSLKFILFLLLK